MNRIARITLFTLLLTFCAVALTLLTTGRVRAADFRDVFVVNGTANPVPVRTAAPSAVTHVGQDATQLVILAYTGTTFTGRVQQIGTLDPSWFVPNGSALVVTDVDWLGAGQSPGDAGQLIVTIFTGAGEQDVLRSTGVVSANLLVGGSVNMTTGYQTIVKPTLHIFGPIALTKVIVRGYLVPCAACWPTP